MKAVVRGHDDDCVLFDLAVYRPEETLDGLIKRLIKRLGRIVVGVNEMSKRRPRNTSLAVLCDELCCVLQQHTGSWPSPKTSRLLSVLAEQVLKLVSMGRARANRLDHIRVENAAVLCARAEGWGI
eukprot:scaffold8311_cov71-Phaeocystis_antarctica.AAC.6